MEQSLNIDATVNLYKSLDAYIITEDSMLVANADAATIQHTLTVMANNMIESHAPVRYTNFITELVTHRITGGRGYHGCKNPRTLRGIRCTSWRRGCNLHRR